MNKKIKWVGMLASACVFACGLGVYNASRVQATANETAAFWDGFAITGTAVRTQDPVGLRFKTDVERLTPTMKKYNPDAEYYTVLTLTTGGKEYTTTRYADVWRPDGSGWNTVLLGIPESDYETKVTAQSFVKLNGKEQAFYQTEAVTVSISQAAAAAMSYGATSEYITQYVDEIVTDITLEQTSATMEVGQTVSLTATTTPSGYMAKWTSSDTSVATVDNTGNVKAKAVGTATITAEINGLTSSCSVSVTAREESIETFSSKSIPDWVKFYYTNSSDNAGGALEGVIPDTTKVTQKMRLSTGTSGADDDYALWLQTGPTEHPQFCFMGDFLDRVFEADDVTALAFDFKGFANGKRTITTPNGKANFSTVNGEWQTVTITRAAYDSWKTLGQSYYEFTWINTDAAEGGTGSVIAYLDNFRYVIEYDETEESQELTQEEIDEIGRLIPNYEYSNLQFEFYGYSMMNDGKWTYYDEETGETTEIDSGEDYRNVYRIEEYKDVGMTVVFPQSACSASGTNFKFATSKLKEVMDMSLEAGMNKLIVSDYRLYGLIQEESIVGEGKAFATEADLDAQVKAYMKDYAAHEAFYGVQLLDEPQYTKFKAQGEVYKSIKRLYPNAYIQCNLFPPTGGNVIGTILPTPSEETLAKYSGYEGVLATRFAAYDEYLNMFLDETGADYIMYDHYPFSDSGTYVSYVGGMQVAANVCAARGVQFKFVSQTMTRRASAEDTNSRILTEADLRWLNNMQLGFGAKELAYYTYFTKTKATEDNRYVDGGSFITHDGEKTDIYYTMRKILAENQAFAPVLLEFDYTSSATYISDNAMYSTTNAQNCISGTFEKIESVEINKECALVTELYDKSTKRYMYMVQNLIPPENRTVVTTKQTAKITFNEDYGYAIVWKNGKKSIVKLENNTFVAKLQSGEAVYVIPFNVADEAIDGYVYDVSKGDNGAWWPSGEQGETPWTPAE